MVKLFRFLAAVFLLNREMVRAERQEIALTTDITAQQLQLRLESCVRPRISAVNFMADRQFSSEAQLLAEWDELAYPIVSMLPGIQAINFVNSDWVIMHVYPRESNRPALNADLREAADPEVPQAMAQAEASGELVRTDPIELLQSSIAVSTPATAKRSVSSTACSALRTCWMRALRNKTCRISSYCVCWPPMAHSSTSGATVYRGRSG